MTQTITEALAEIKTIEKRLAKKQEFINQHLCRQDRIRDPLEKSGGSRTVIESERQSFNDLAQHLVDLRLAINASNAATDITVDGSMKSVAEWLVWRRDIAPTVKAFLNKMNATIQNVRQEAQRKGLAVTTGDPASLDDVIVNIDEVGLANEIEHMETVLGELDGLLSLKNATVFV